MGQVNVSLSDDTKRKLVDLQKHYHCTSVSETVNRLVWDADIQRCSGDASHASESSFNMMRMIVVMDQMKKEFCTAFRNDYLYSTHEFERMVQRGMITEHADRHAFIYGRPAGVAVSDAILRFTKSPSELVCTGGNKWLGCLEVDCWRFDDMFKLAKDDIMIRPVLVSTPYNKLMESMPSDSNFPAARLRTTDQS